MWRSRALIPSRGKAPLVVKTQGNARFSLGVTKRQIVPFIFRFYSTVKNENECATAVVQKEYRVMFFGNDEVSLPTLQLLYNKYAKDSNHNNESHKQDEQNEHKKKKKSQKEEFTEEWIQNEPIKDILNSSPYKISKLHVISSPDSIPNVFGAVKKFAISKGLSYCQPEDLNAWYEESLNSKNADENISNYNLAVVTSYGYLIPTKVICKLELGGVNVHPSELPYYRGAAPLYQQLLFNDPASAVSVIRLNPEVFDSGNLLLQWKFKMLKETNFPMLARFTSMVGALAINYSLANFTTLLQNQVFQQQLLPENKDEPLLDLNAHLNQKILSPTSVQPPPEPTLTPDTVAKLTTVTSIPDNYQSLIVDNIPYSSNFPLYTSLHPQINAEEEYPAIPSVLRPFNAPKICNSDSELKWSYYPSLQRVIGIYRAFSAPANGSKATVPYHSHLFTYFLWQQQLRSGVRKKYQRVQLVSIIPPSPSSFKPISNNKRFRSGQAYFDKTKKVICIWLTFHPFLSQHIPPCSQHKILKTSSVCHPDPLGTEEETSDGFWIECSKLQVDGGDEISALDFANAYFVKSTPFFFFELPPNTDTSSYFS